MKKSWKKSMGIFIIVAMIFTMLPTMAFADEGREQFNLELTAFGRGEIAFAGQQNSWLCATEKTVFFRTKRLFFSTFHY